MCPKCQGFSEKMSLSSPHELFDLVGQIHEIIAQGTIEFVEGNCSLDEIAPNKPWPADYIECFFRCASCGHRFWLHVETYHGAGGAWEMLTE